MSNFTITIVGTGVIGTSLGLALKQLDDPPRLLGHDKELAHTRAAVQAGAFDKAEWNLVNACEEADLIILAIPVDGVRPTLEAVAPYLREGAIISDTSRSKVSILAWAKELLPDHAHFVGGNPIVRPSGTGHEHARADLFHDRLYCLTPALTADETAVQLLVDFVTVIGAKPFFLGATEHDGLMTAAEYLPAALGVALLDTVSSQGSWREVRKLAGSLFEQVTSGAVGTPEALVEDWSTNRNSLVHWLDTYVNQLNQLRTLLAATDSEEALTQVLDQAIVERQNWLTDYQKGQFGDPELESVGVKSPSFVKRMIGFGR